MPQSRCKQVSIIFAENQFDELQRISDSSGERDKILAYDRCRITIIITLCAAFEVRSKNAETIFDVFNRSIYPIKPVTYCECYTLDPSVSSIQRERIILASKPELFIRKHTLKPNLILNKDIDLRAEHSGVIRVTKKAVSNHICDTPRQKHVS